MIWDTVSSWSFCWLYRASPSSATKNIINLISVLTIWWCPCVESSLVLLEDDVCYDQCVLLISILKKISPGCSLEGMTLKLKLQYSGHLMWRVDSLEKTDAARDWGQEEKGTLEDEMAGWHHRLDGHESEWTLGVGDGQGGLACCDSWGCKESDTTEWLNWTAMFLFAVIADWKNFCSIFADFWSSSVEEVLAYKYMMTLLLYFQFFNF